MQHRNINARVNFSDAYRRLSLRLASEALEKRTRRVSVSGNKIRRQPPRRSVNCAESFPLDVFSRLSINSGSADDAHRNLDYDYLRADNCQCELYKAPYSMLSQKL